MARLFGRIVSSLSPFIISRTTPAARCSLTQNLTDGISTVLAKTSSMVIPHLCDITYLKARIKSRLRSFSYSKYEPKCFIFPLCFYTNLPLEINRYD